MKIGIFGFGAVGASIYNELHDYKDLYILMDGNRKEKYKDGITINGKNYNPNIITNGIMDLVIVSVKNYSLEEALPSLKNFIDTSTIILPLLNGITARDVILKYYPNNNVLYGLIFVESNKDGLNVETSKIINICFGEKNNEVIKDYLLEIKNIFDKYNVNNEICKNMLAKQYSKWMLNLGINQISALCNATYKDMSHPLIKEVLYQIFGEVYEVSKAYNVGMSDDDYNKIKERCEHFTSNRVTSLTMDFNNNDRNELDAFSYTLLKLAKEKNIKCPVNELLYKLLKAKDDNNKRKRASL